MSFRFDKEPDFKKGNGLIPAVVQNAITGQVLMLGYMNKEALIKTQKTGLVTFFSRSRKTLWTKGETSGHTLDLVDIKLDCDQDTFLVRARPNGPTCHLGTISCFGTDAPDAPDGLGWLAHLGQVIEGRKTADPESSYTAKLLSGPLTKAAQKVGEEGVETVIAALAETDEGLIGESADLIYHLMVVLAARGLSLEDVVEKLKSRHQ